MDFGQREIQDIVQSIWEIVLGSDVQLTSASDLPCENHAFRTGVIQITGAWEGAVVCIGSEALVRRAALVMFRISQDALTIELLHDALGELTNMVGGNLKSLLPGPSYLCLPTVVKGSDYSACVFDLMPVVEAAFLCDGQPFTVKLLEAQNSLHCAPPTHPRATNFGSPEVMTGNDR